MRAERDIAKRMRDILTHDKINVKEGFSTALTGDLNKLLGDYFELTSPAEIDIVLCPDGNYKITTSATASHIKQFDTTYDLR